MIWDVKSGQEFSVRWVQQEHSDRGRPLVNCPETWRERCFRELHMSLHSWRAQAAEAGVRAKG